MPSDAQAHVARYYDLQPFAEDLPFYERLLPDPEASVLELGCGTGRVLVPLARQCGFIQGLDLSPAMLEVCRERLVQAGLPDGRAIVERGDISAFRLGRRFDLIIAPFRVFQALETDPEVVACLRSIADHLAPGGTGVLSMFQPNLPSEEMARGWRREEEVPEWEATLPGGDRLTCSSLRQSLEPDNLVLYPDLIYRRFQGGRMVDHCVQPISMRCWYPQQILALLRDRGFRIVDSWGGYDGEVFGDGPELVVQFSLAE